MIITSLQLAQMVIGCAINIWAFDYLKTAGRMSCNISQINIKLSIAMYFSYFVLFARFFYKTYLSSGGKKSKRSTAIPTSSMSSADTKSSPLSEIEREKLKAQ